MLLVGLAASVVAGAYWNPLALAGLVLLPIVWVWMWRRGSGESQKAPLAAAQERVRSLRRRLEREQAASGVPGLATRARALYRELSAFSQRRAERLQDLRRSPRERQLRRYLDQFEVKDCPLKGVGRGLVATLVSHGIETAEDLTESSLNGVPGFGPKRVSALLGWKHSLESKFRFNPSDRADRLEPDRVERELLTEYAQGIAELRRISQELETCAAPLRLRTETLAGELEAAQQELALMTATT
jgi:DNA-binding helix-hairpin-helix protein with protein kinase domain